MQQPEDAGWGCRKCLRVRTKRRRPDSLPTLVFAGRWRSGRNSLAFVYALHPWRFVRARRRFGADLSKIFFFAELLLVCFRRLGDHVHQLGFVFLAHGIRYFFLGGEGGRCGTINPFPGKLGSGRGCGDRELGRGGCEGGTGCGIRLDYLRVGRGGVGGRGGIVWP